MRGEPRITKEEAEADGFPSGPLASWPSPMPATPVAGFGA